jgi:3-phosphoshikimate 1-carboxyvinyltransferase
VLGCFAEGETVVRDAAELRAKESDRVEAVVQLLGRMGVRISDRPDGFTVTGPAALRGARVNAGGDHRIGMLAGVAGALAEGETRIDNDAVAVSYPTFWDDFARASEGAPARP